MAPSSQLVSVVIPVFNRGREVVAAVESALAQTWPHKEIIVVDDGSTDHTADRLKAFGSQIRYVHQENGGPAVARNTGIGLAAGSWVAFLDSDDLWMPSKLASQMQCLEEFVGIGDVCFTDCQFFGDSQMEGSAFEKAGLRSEKANFLLPDPVALIFGREPALWIQSSVIRRQLLLDLGGFDESLVVVEDTDLILRMSLNARFCCVRSLLVKISRPSERKVGLIEILSERSDRPFRIRERMYKKWLRISKGTHEAAYRLTNQHLKSLHYCWLIARIYRLEPWHCLDNIRGLRSCGESYWEILSRLAFRGRRRLRTMVRSLLVSRGTDRIDSTARKLDTPR